jgi:hypothetical protein
MAWLALRNSRFSSIGVTSFLELCTLSLNQKSADGLLAEPRVARCLTVHPSRIHVSKSPSTWHCLDRKAESTPTNGGTLNLSSTSAGPVGGRREFWSPVYGVLRPLICVDQYEVCVGHARCCPRPSRKRDVPGHAHIIIRNITLLAHVKQKQQGTRPLGLHMIPQTNQTFYTALWPRKETDSCHVGHRE